MKTTSTFKLRMIELALKEEIAVSVRIRGSSEWYRVKGMKNHAHTLIFTLDRNAGFLAVEPDSLAGVQVPKLPSAFQPEAI